MRESELYPALKRHFEGLGYRVYAEVPAPHGGYVDLLAVRDPVTVAVELKSRFSREAVRQAGRNKRFVWESYVAVPQGARIAPRRRSALKRHRAGLLLVAGSDVLVCLEAGRTAPPYTLREVFGNHLRGQLADAYGAAQGGVPTRSRFSAFSLLLAKLKGSLEAYGGLANTDQVHVDTLSWNYFRNQRAGLLWILRNRFRSAGRDLWSLEKTRRLVSYELPLQSLVRTHLADTYVCLPAPDFSPRPGDYLNLRSGRKLQRKARVISATRHPIVETPQRELRAGPALFFPWRCPAGVPMPPETLVIRLAPLRA